MNLEFRNYIKAVGTGPKLSRDLTPEEAERAFRLIMEGKATEAQIAGLLVPLRMKGESIEELAVFVKVTREFCHQIHPSFKYFVDVGIPYDGKKDFPHLSPLAAFVAAGAGVQVFMHGQSQTPPKYGVSVRDVFMELGASIDMTITEAQAALDEVGVAFVSIEHISLRLAELSTLREELGLRTAFNHIEKLWNPANSPNQMVSVYHGPYLEKIPKVLQRIGSPHVLVIQGMEGTSDLRLSRKAKAVEVRHGETSELLIDPRALGFEPGEEPLYKDLNAGTTAEVTQKALDLSGASVFKDLAILNGAMIIYASGLTDNLRDAVDRARDSLLSKQALNKLNVLRSIAKRKVQGLKSSKFNV